MIMKPAVAIIALALVSAGIAQSRAGPAAGQDSAAPATLTWNRIALETIERAKPTQHVAVRVLAHVSLAQHAAATESVAPDARRAAIATASMRVIAGMLPAQAAYVESRYRQVDSGTSEPGERIAQRVLAQAAGDGFTQPWTGQVPQAAYAWRSLVQPTAAPPAYPAIGAMRPFFLDSGSVLRPAPPPALGSSRFSEDLAQVRSLTQSPSAESVRIARFYDMTTGTLAGGFWNEQAQALLRASTLDEPRAAVVLATLNAAMMDALIACHDAKYTYWVPRPSQADPSIKPIIGVPNHPSYPSNHSCLSTAAGHVLAHFFPRDRAKLEGHANEAGQSRIHAGLHYRFDLEAGEDIGRKVAARAIERHGDMLARWTRTLVGGL
jgi:hypothetical protein